MKHSKTHIAVTPLLKRAKAEKRFTLIKERR